MNRQTIFALGVSVLMLTACGGGGGGGEETPPPPETTLISIDVAPTDTFVPAGTGETFTATGNYSDGTSTDVTATVSWSSSDENVATVNASGEATAVGAPGGAATITATLGGVSGAAGLTVNDAALARLTVGPDEAEIPVGLEQRFRAKGHFTDGSARWLSRVTWSSADEGVATMAVDGTATGASSGTVKIIAAAGSTTGAARLRVTRATLNKITVNPDSIQIPENTTFQFEAQATASDGNSYDITGKTTWSASDVSGFNVASVTQRGLARGNNPGDARIGAKFGALQARADLEVTDAVLQSITIAPTTGFVINPSGLRQLVPGATGQLVATGRYSNNSDQDITADVAWMSSDHDVATVNGNGEVTGKNGGNVVITARKGVVSDTISISVLNVGTFPIQDIAVTPANPSVRYNTELQLTATGVVLPDNVDLTSTATWSSSRSDIASVDGQGVVTGLKPGTAPITATYDGVSETVDLRVLGKVSVPQTGQTLCYNAAGGSINCIGSGQDGELHAGATTALRFGFADFAAGCISDNLTGLTWVIPADLRNGLLITRTWLEAILDAETLNICGHSDWRLPNWNELRSLIDYGEANPALQLENIGFDAMTFADGLFWTSSSHYGTSFDIFVGITAENAWVIDLTTGLSQPADKIARGSVIAVRGGAR